MTIRLCKIASGFCLMALCCAALAESSLLIQARNLFGQIEAANPSAIDDPVVRLGQQLFWDKRTSANAEVACASCHLADEGSSDARVRSLTAKGTLTARHSQPVFNAVGQVGLRWTGDRPDAAAQARGSLTGSMGFASDEKAMEKLQELGYEPLFRVAFPEDEQPLTPQRYGEAIAAYEKTLTTPAPFDRFLGGEESALSPEQKNGLQEFMAVGCSACHNGARLGGEMLQKFGIYGNYWQLTNSETIDKGRFENTGKAGDEYVFRVPMLRNIVATAPYFHDGSVVSLEDAVAIMAELQLGKTLEAQSVKSIVTFLQSLSGEVPEHYKAPDLP